MRLTLLVMIVFTISIFSAKNAQAMKCGQVASGLAAEALSVLGALPGSSGSKMQKMCREMQIIQGGANQLEAIGTITAEWTYGTERDSTTYDWFDRFMRGFSYSWRNTRDQVQTMGNIVNESLLQVVAGAGRIEDLKNSGASVTTQAEFDAIRAQIAAEEASINADVDTASDAAFDFEMEKITNITTEFCRYETLDSSSILWRRVCS